jgi:hypothetical protein
LSGHPTDSLRYLSKQVKTKHLFCEKLTQA